MTTDATSPDCGTLLTPGQRAALQAAQEGNVAYGSTNPYRDRIAHSAARRKGERFVTQPRFVVNGRLPKLAEAAVLAQLARSNLIRARVDLVEIRTVAARRVSVRLHTGTMTTRIVPAHNEPADPGWRCPVEITDTGRAALEASTRIDGAA